MVSYYNPATVAMFSRTGSGHYHHHHSPPTQNPYFGPAAAAAAYSGYHHPHAHSHPHAHQQGSGGSPVGVGTGIGVGSGLTGVSSTQFSPSMTTDFNCNHSQYHPHQFSNMTPDPMAGASWHQSSMYTSACAAARNAAALGVAPHPGSYEDWTVGTHPAVSAGHHPHVHPHHPSFYHHAQPSPPSSTPSPNSSHPGGNHSPHNHVYSTSSTTPNNNNNGSPFKTEFGPCSGGNPQENASQEMNSQVVVSSGGPSIGNPHSPDSGMAISDGVSSSGSPATGQQYQNNCLGGPSSSGNGSNAPTAANGANDNNNNNNLLGSQNPMLHHGSHLHHSHHHLSLSQGANNLNQMSVPSHQSPLLNASNGRPTQARSPYEWMKKPSYSVGSSSSNNAKTRTKDKYRVVYSDTQRLELEKEFHYSRYITIRRKAELASILGLSERQVKIWFQNRRAKERKIVRKREEMMQRENIANISRAHMQNAAVAAAGGMGGIPGNPMCNQSNGGLPILM